jgi:tripartite-type tricarboxylate transporter receptor subunit TctC
MIDLLEGRVSSLFVNYSDVRQHVQAGKLKVFASTGPKRSRFTPEVPTMLEAGFPGFETLSWTGFFAPAGTPAPIVEKIAADIREAARKPEFQKRLQELCVEPVDSDPASFSRMLKEEYAGCGRIVANAGVKLD